MTKAAPKAYSDLHDKVVDIINQAYASPSWPSAASDGQTDTIADNRVNTIAHVALLRALKNEQEDAFLRTYEGYFLTSEINANEVLHTIWQVVSEAKDSDPDIVHFGAMRSSDKELWANVREAKESYNDAMFMFFKLAKEPRSVLIEALHDEFDSFAALDYLAGHSDWDLDLVQEIVDATLSARFFSRDGLHIIQRIGRAHPDELRAALKSSMGRLLAGAGSQHPADTAVETISAYQQSWFLLSDILLGQKEWDLQQELIDEIKGALANPKGDGQEDEGDRETVAALLRQVEKDRASRKPAHE